MELYVEDTKARVKVRFSESKAVFDAKATDNSAIGRKLPKSCLMLHCSEIGKLVPVIRPVPYMQLAGRLDIFCVRGRHLPSTQTLGIMSPFLEITIEGRGRKKFRTPSVKEGGETPVWNHLISTELHHDDTSIYFRLMSESTSLLGQDKIIGRSVSNRKT